MRLALLVLLLSSTAVAGEFKETLPKADRDAIVAAIQGNLPPVDKAAVPKCQAMLDEYNKAPETSVDKTFEAGTCLKAAGSLGAALASFKLYERYGKDEAKLKDTLRGLAATYEAAAYFREAAAAGEDFAKKYPGEKDAMERLVRAICIRRQLGDDLEAKNSGAYLERKFKRKADAALCASVTPIAMPAKKR